MSRKRLSMRKVTEVLRLLWAQDRSAREVAKSCQLARSTVKEYERRAQAAGLSWPLPDVDDATLEGLLFPPPPQVASDDRPVPDWALVDKELRRKGVTRALLWDEYRSANPEGYSYTRYCELFQAWRGVQGRSMRQTHVAGERVFVDYAGQTIPIADPVSGVVRAAPVFVGALGASHYAYAEATWTQGQEDWVMAQVRMLEFFDGCPEVLVPDNLKVGVLSAHRYEPEVNPSYLEFARHYGLAVVPARARSPKDKAVVESAVQVVGRWVLARLRNRTFFSLSEANDAIRALIVELNERPFQKRAGSRRSYFVELDRPALRPLPAVRYEFASWKRVRAHVDYHVTVDDHHYSVPHQLVGKELDARLTPSTIEVFFRNKRVASHPRSARKGAHTTVREHMPPAHQEHAGTTEASLRAWATRVGPGAVRFTDALFASRAHSHQAMRSCLGVLRLGKRYGDVRLDAACARALALGSVTFKSVDAILKNHLDEQPLEARPEAPLPKAPHENVRGGDYFASTPPARNEATVQAASAAC